MNRVKTSSTTSNAAFLLVALVAIGVGLPRIAVGLTALAAGSAYYHSGGPVVYDYIGMYWSFACVFLTGWWLVGALAGLAVVAYVLRVQWQWARGSVAVVGLLAAAALIYTYVQVGAWAILPTVIFAGAVALRYLGPRRRHDDWHYAASLGYLTIILLL